MRMFLWKSIDVITYIILCVKIITKILNFALTDIIICIKAAKNQQIEMYGWHVGDSTIWMTDDQTIMWQRDRETERQTEMDKGTEWHTWDTLVTEYWDR
jgi:hypothetical protein